MRWLARRLLVVALTLSACAREPPPHRVVHVRVVDDDQKPIGAVGLEIDGISSVKTSIDGTATISLAATGAPRARIGALCPPDMQPVEPRHVGRAAGPSAARIELSFTCRPKLRTVVVVVRASGAAGLTARADGQPLGELDSEGTLHAVLTRPPQSELRLMVDTGDSALVPRNPTRVLHIADRDEILVFDQAFAAPAKPRVRVRAPPAKHHEGLPRVVPYAIRGPGS